MHNCALRTVQSSVIYRQPVVYANKLERNLLQSRENNKDPLETGIKDRSPTGLIGDHHVRWVSDRFGMSVSDYDNIFVISEFKISFF